MEATRHERAGLISGRACPQYRKRKGCACRHCRGVCACVAPERRAMPKPSPVALLYAAEAVAVVGLVTLAVYGAAQ